MARTVTLYCQQCPAELELPDRTSLGQAYHAGWKFKHGTRNVAICPSCVLAATEGAHQ